VEADAGLLGRCGLIDYSMLLVVGLDTGVIRVGIIDYMRPYNVSEAV
jgi:hypothetical protein